MKSWSSISRSSIRTAIISLVLVSLLTALAMSEFTVSSGSPLPHTQEPAQATSGAERTRRIRENARASQKKKEPAPEGSTGSTALYTITGSGGSTAFGDYVSDAGALNTSYHYYIEVPPGQSRLEVDLFDADVGLGGAGEAGAGRDRARGAFNTSANYSIFNPSGAARTTVFTTGNTTLPAGGDNAWLALFDSTGDNVRDNFSATAYNNNNGVVNWAGNWSETNDDNNAGAGLILITGNQLRIRDDGGASSAIQREANLNGSGFTTATLNFDFSTANVGAGDQMSVEVSANGGGSWTTLETFTGAGSGSRSYDITSSIATNTRIRFIEVAGYFGTDSFFVDNIEIKETGIDSGHWELRVNMSSAVTAGDDINALGLRAHDGTSGAGGTELNIYVDSINGFGVNPPASGTTSRTYAIYPFITSGCSYSENDFDFDSNNGNVGSFAVTSRSGSFSQTVASALLSVDNNWKRNNITGWTTDGTADDYGIWDGTVTVNSYLVGSTPNGNYADFYITNSQAAANPPTSNPAVNSMRMYLPTDAGVAPVKPYLEQTFANFSGFNPPPVGMTIPMTVTVTIANPTSQALTFDASHLVTANVPGSGAVYGGSAQVTQGAVVSQPAVGGTGNVTWNPGTLAAGDAATLSYVVNVLFTSSGQRIPLTATPASGNGTRATYIDETGNATQARASYTFGPLCELAATAGSPTAATASIRGVITTTAGEPLAGVTVKLSGDGLDRTITDANGGYRFTDVEIDGFYSVTPTRANFRFSPSQRSFPLLGDRTDAVFTALPLAETANPLDEEGFFVRQQYVDFLGREPDHGGWLYWTDEIASCGFDAACVRARRIAVSAAFFASEEFQNTGSFVYRLYRAALGRQLSYNEFLVGRSRIEEGANREASQISFARDFVQQPEFVGRYAQHATAEQFVDAVIAGMQSASGVDVSGRRAQLLAVYNGGVDVNDSRAAVMREAIDDAQFMQAEFNRAFVLMQYFGYLRRDPDQGGYDFWLDILNNREPNNYRAMVCAFVTSTEYQQRFSTAVTRGNSECGQ